MTKATNLFPRNLAITIGALEERNISKQAKKYGISATSAKHSMETALDHVFITQRPKKYEKQFKQLNYNNAKYSQCYYPVPYYLKDLFNDREYILQVIREYCEDKDLIIGDYGK